MLDLVFPRNNEQALVEMAARFGATRVICCYFLDDPHLAFRKKELEKFRQLEVEFAIAVETQQDIQKARKFTENIVGIAKPEFFDDKHVTYVINFESGKRRDFMHHRNAGLTQVFVQNAMRNNITLLVNCNQLLADDGKILGRMKQNNLLYRKYKPQVFAVSGASLPLDMRTPRDMQTVLQL